MKKLYLLIIFLIISLIFSILFARHSFLTQKLQKQSSNNLLLSSLSAAQTHFGIDYTKMDENSKISNYIMASSNLHTAIYLLPYTSYTNQDLFNALYGLYLTMTVQNKTISNNRWLAVTKKRNDIFNCLYYISLNPNDKNNCKELIKITDNLLKTEP